MVPHSLRPCPPRNSQIPRTNFALPDPIPDPLVELLANRLRVIGEPTRIRVLGRLRHGPASVQELVDAAGTTQQNVSKHLTRLTEHGFITRERRGRVAILAAI